MFAHNNARRVALNKLTRAQLVSLLVDTYEIPCSDIATKAQIIDLILNHEAALQQAESSEVEF